MNILTASNLSKTYSSGKQKVHATKNMDFSIDKGEIFSILGPNGSGKTTLINMLCGLLSPCQGEVLYEGKEIFSNLNKYKNSIGAVLEGNRNIYWYLSARENLRYFGRLSFLEDSFIEKKSDELLDFFELTSFQNDLVGHFSRGMQQKIAICVALLNNPKILFLDEPTLGLDIITKKKVIPKIRELAEKYKMTIILTTHNLEIAEKLSDRILLISKGKTVILKKTEKLLEDIGTNTLNIHIEKDDIQKVRKLIRSINGIKANLELGDEYLDLKLSFARKNKQLTQSIIQDLYQKNIGIIGLKQKEASLEDIFVDIYTKKNNNHENVKNLQPRMD